MTRTIAPDRIPEPPDVERQKPAQDDDELLSIDIDLEDDDIETTTKISLDEARRLLDAAFAPPA